MTWVLLHPAARPKTLRVTVSRRRPAAYTEITVDEAVLETEVNGTVDRLVGGITHPLWRLEVAKSAAHRLAAPVGAAFRLVDAAATAAGEGRSGQGCYALRSTDAPAVAHAAALELARRGERVERLWRFRIAAAARLLAAAPTAFAVLFGALLRYGGGTGPVPQERQRLAYAVHSELSNRTRHLLPPQFEPGPRPVYLIVGRPRGTLDKVARIVDPERRMPDMVLLRPANFAAAARSLPEALRLLCAGVSVLRNSPARIPLRECVAIAFRMVQGACHAEWWGRARLTADSVAFGHTGLADTTALEGAMQASGTRTIHCVHGISGGWNFAGHSDVGLFVCGHDATLARRFPAYDKTTALPAPRPEPVPGDGRWLVLTSYTHPMNPAYASRGIAADRAALEMVAEAARRRRQLPGDIVWRPHPALARVNADHRHALVEFAARHGFAIWPDGKPYEELDRFGIVMTTPSTAATDALRLGKLPVIIVTAPLQPDMVYSSFPHVVGDATGLGRVVSRSRNKAVVRTAFGKTWDTILPGRPLDFPALCRAAG